MLGTSTTQQWSCKNSMYRVARTNWSIKNVMFGWISWHNHKQWVTICTASLRMALILSYTAFGGKHIFPRMANNAVMANFSEESYCGQKLFRCLCYCCVLNEGLRRERGITYEVYMIGREWKQVYKEQNIATSRCCMTALVRPLGS